MCTNRYSTNQLDTALLTGHIKYWRALNSEPCMYWGVRGAALLRSPMPIGHGNPCAPTLLQEFLFNKSDSAVAKAFALHDDKLFHSQCHRARDGTSW